MSRSVFDPVAARYDASRPSYPDALYDSIERLTGPLAGRRVLELGAGTGIATRGLLGRGALVVGLDIGARMLAQLRVCSPGVPVVLGDGAALPVGDGSIELVASAQAFHWLPIDRTVPEVVRVLRRGGALALWWNHSELPDTPWTRAQDQRFEETPSGCPGQLWPGGVDSPLRATGWFDRIEQLDLRWTWRVPIEDYVGYIGSKSAVVRLGTDAAGFLDHQRDALAATFPDGTVVEPFRCSLTVAWPR